MAGEVPDGFEVRSPRWILVVLWASVLAYGIALLLDFTMRALVLTAIITFAATSQQSWRGRVRPDGLAFRSRVGVGWERPWSDLRPDVVVNRPGRLGTLVRGRLRTGRRVSIPNGRVTTLAGERIAPDTARTLIQAWVRAATPDPSD